MFLTGQKDDDMYISLEAMWISLALVVSSGVSSPAVSREIVKEGEEATLRMPT